METQTRMDSVLNASFSELAIRAKHEIASSKAYITLHPSDCPWSMRCLPALSLSQQRIMIGHLARKSGFTGAVITSTAKDIYYIRRVVDNKRDMLEVRLLGNLETREHGPHAAVIIPTNMPQPYIGSYRNDQFWHGCLESGASILLPSRFTIDETRPCSKSYFTRKPTRQGLSDPTDFSYIVCDNINLI